MLGINKLLPILSKHVNTLMHANTYVDHYVYMIKGKFYDDY